MITVLCGPMIDFHYGMTPRCLRASVRLRRRSKWYCLRPLYDVLTDRNEILTNSGRRKREGRVSRRACILNFTLPGAPKERHDGPPRERYCFQTTSLAADLHRRRGGSIGTSVYESRTRTSRWRGMMTVSGVGEILLSSARE